MKDGNKKLSVAIYILTAVAAGFAVGCAVIHGVFGNTAACAIASVVAAVAVALGLYPYEIPVEDNATEEEIKAAERGRYALSICYTSSIIVFCVPMLLCAFSVGNGAFITACIMSFVYSAVCGSVHKGYRGERTDNGFYIRVAAFILAAGAICAIMSVCFCYSPLIGFKKESGLSAKELVPIIIAVKMLCDVLFAFGITPKSRQ